MIYRGHIKNGAIVLDTPTLLPEGMAVEISEVGSSLDIEGQPIDPAFLIGDLAVDMGASDLAIKHDQDRSSPAKEVIAETPLDIQGHPIDPLFRMVELAVDMGIPDLAMNIDHYLYGHPKVKVDEK